MDKKILLIIFYSPIEYINYFCKNDTIDFFPLYKYKYDTNDRITNYYDLLKDTIDNNQKKFLIWFFLDGETVNNIKNDYSNIINISIIYNEKLNIELFNTLKFMDVIYTNDDINIDRMKILLDKKHIYNFTSSYNDFIYNSNIQKNKDIIIYISSIDYLQESDIIDIHLYAINNHLSIDLYGPPILESLFPNIYVDELDEIDFAIVVQESKYCFYLDHFSYKNFYSNCIKIIISNTLLYVKILPLYDKILSNYAIELAFNDIDLKYTKYTHDFSSWVQTVDNIYKHISYSFDT